MCIDRRVFARHHIRDTQSTQSFRDHHLRITLTRSAQQKPTNEREPYTIDTHPAEELHHAINDHEEGDDLTDARRDIGRAPRIPSDPPQEPAQHAPAVEWKAWNHVEDREADVDYTEPHQDCGQWLLWESGRSPPQRERNPETNQPDDKARDWTNDPHPEFRLRVGRFFFDLCNTTEREERDRSHGQPARLRHQ